VPLSRAKSIDELYSEVGGYGLVVTPSVPLARGLNRRLDEAHLGYFAATPRMLATGGPGKRDAETVFRALATGTYLDWKSCYIIAETALGYWEETGSLDGFEQHLRGLEDAEQVLEIILEADTAHRQLENFSLEQDSVAVVGESWMSELERSVLPGSYESINPFRGGEEEAVPEFQVFDSSESVVDAILDNVGEEVADRVAIVMDTAGPFPALVESAFRANDVPYISREGVSRQGGVRTFLTTLRTGIETTNPTVNRVRGLLSFIGEDTYRVDGEKRIDTLDHDGVESVNTLLDKLTQGTFAEALKTFEERTGADLKPLRREVSELEMLNTEVSDRALSRLEFFIDSYNPSLDSESEGVLLVDAKSDPYVDREVMFYLGMDADWTRDIPGRPWMDSERRDRENLEKFQALIQNGENQIYAVQNSRQGDAVTPCIYLHELVSKDFEEFRDLPHRDYGSIREDSGPAFESPVEEGSDAESVGTLSQSELKTFANSPKDLFFDQLVETPDRDYFTKGNVLHDFAELYVEEPGLVEETGLEELVEWCLEEMEPFLPRYRAPVLETSFLVGMRNVKEFIDANRPFPDSPESYSPGPWGNALANHLGVEVESGVAEQFFHDEELRARGIVDLVLDETHLVDFKTGSQNSRASVVRDASVDPVSDTPDFQAPMYLAHHRRRVPGEKLRFTFLHVLDNLGDRISGGGSLDDIATTVTYHPETFPEYAASREAFDAQMQVSESNDRWKALDRMGYEAYREFFERNEFPDVDGKDELLETDFAEKYVRHGEREVGRHKYVERGAGCL